MHYSLKVMQEEKSKHDHVMKSKSETIEQTLSFTLFGAVKDGKEPGASSWLSALPWKGSSFVLNKKEFCNTFSFRYAKELEWLL